MFKLLRTLFYPSKLATDCNLENTMKPQTLDTAKGFKTIYPEGGKKDWYGAKVENTWKQTQV